jgi:hypothetical protein
VFRRTAIALIVLALLPVLYVGSFAPLTWLMRRDWLDRTAYQSFRESFYSPLDRWMWDGSGTANDLYWRWHRLWDD